MPILLGLRDALFVFFLHRYYSLVVVFLLEASISSVLGNVNACW